MSRALRFAALGICSLLCVSGCSHRLDLSRPSTQMRVGVDFARKDLWREALFRFHRASELDSNDAMILNDLAVAYEANGDFEKAKATYGKALELDRSNPYIQKNYSRFVEFYSRSLKREKAAAEATPGSAKTPPAEKTPPPAEAPPSGTPQVPPATSATPPGGEAAPPSSSAPPAPVPEKESPPPVQTPPPPDQSPENQPQPVKPPAQTPPPSQNPPPVPTPPPPAGGTQSSFTIPGGVE
ncbi:MAG: tetratricopeptide repeat protein [Thermoanaerobaculia bacterium]